MKVVLKKNGTIDANGSIIGTWLSVDVWSENGSSRDRSGNKLVHYQYKANLNDGSEIMQYTKADLRQAIINHKNK